MKVFIYEKVDIENEDIKVDRKFNFFESFLDWMLSNDINPQDIELYTNLIAKIPIVYIPKQVTNNKLIQYYSSENTKIISIILEYAKLNIIFKSIVFVDLIYYEEDILVDREMLNKLLNYYDKLMFINLWEEDVVYIYDKNGFTKVNRKGYNI